MGMRVITFKAEEEFLRKIDLFAINEGMYRSEAIRYLIEKGFEKIAEEKQPKTVISREL